MTPLNASWLVKACVVLHNRCLDWGLRKLRRSQNRDPEHEMNIQVRAHMRFTRYNLEITAEELPPERERYGSRTMVDLCQEEVSKDVNVEWVTVHADADVGVALLLMNAWEGQFELVVYTDVDVDADADAGNCKPMQY